MSYLTGPWWLLGLLVSVILIAVAFVISYFLIKLAVRNGTYDALKKMEEDKHKHSNSPSQ